MTLNRIPSVSLEHVQGGPIAATAPESAPHNGGLGLDILNNSTAPVQPLTQSVALASGERAPAARAVSQGNLQELYEQFGANTTALEVAPEPSMPQADTAAHLNLVSTQHSMDHSTDAALALQQRRKRKSEREKQRREAIKAKYEVYGQRYPELKAQVEARWKGRGTDSARRYEGKLKDLVAEAEKLEVSLGLAVPTPKRKPLVTEGAPRVRRGAPVSEDPKIEERRAKGRANVRYWKNLRDAHPDLWQRCLSMRSGDYDQARRLFKQLWREENPQG